MSKNKRPKRRDRFLAAVNTLHFFSQDTDCRKDVLKKLDWAIKNLRKEDRVLWFLGIIRRYHLVTWTPGADQKLPPKDQRKRRAILKHFDLQRVVNDYESLRDSFVPTWPHFQALTKMHDSEALRSMSFHCMDEGRQIPLSVEQVMAELRHRERALSAHTSGRFCTDGEDFIVMEDGWKWVRVGAGYSGQEAKAMGHCGNGAGRKGDVLYSLREPVRKKAATFWRPHLTFICKGNGYFGEMKGRANSKPSSTYHQYITKLLKHPDFRGARGGGYLPQNNFNVTELKSEQIAEIALGNPRFDLHDYWLETGRVLYRFDDEWDLAFHTVHEEPSRPQKSYRLRDPVPMILFRRSIVVKNAVIRMPALILPFVRGYLGVPFSLHSSQLIPDLPSKFGIMLELMNVRGVSAGSIFHAKCPWFPLLGTDSPEQIVERWPAFASATPIPLLASIFGAGPHLAHALSLQLDGEVKQESDGTWTLVRFRTVRHFLERIRDFHHLRLFDSLKEGAFPRAASKTLRLRFLRRLGEFCFDHSDLRLRLENPDTLGSACSLTVSEAGLTKLAISMEPDGVENMEDFILHLIRTYDYDRTRVTLAA